jgi:hypothetical protein
MNFPTISIEVARDALNKHRASEAWTVHSFIRHQGAGEPFDEASVEAVSSGLSEIRKQIGKNPLPKNMAKDFEAPAAEVVHRELKVDISAACSREFWIWLTFAGAGGKLIEFVDWRFGTQKSIDAVNYGLGRPSDIWEGLFARLWWRGRAGFEPSADDPYALARRGDVDIWRSHIIRQEYGRTRNMALALLRFQYPTDAPGPGKIKINHLRELAKRLRVVDANTAYEVLNNEELDELIRTNADEAEAKL